jgi:hypothetical protein
VISGFCCIFVCFFWWTYDETRVFCFGGFLLIYFILRSPDDDEIGLIWGWFEHVQSWLHRKITEAYVSYAMSVLFRWALSDVRDGLKPVYRRILWVFISLIGHAIEVWFMKLLLWITVHVYLISGCKRVLHHVIVVFVSYCKEHVSFYIQMFQGYDDALLCEVTVALAWQLRWQCDFNCCYHMATDICSHNGYQIFEPLSEFVHGLPKHFIAVVNETG